MKKALLAGVMLALAAGAAYAQDAPGLQNAAQTAPGAATPGVTAAQAEAAEGQILANADGVRLGRIVRANADGSVRIIFEGGVVTVPVETLSLNGDRLVTSLSRREVARLSR